MPESVLAVPGDLLAREAALRDGGGSLRPRDAAAALGVPEAALLEARRATGAARRVRGADTPDGIAAILARLPDVGGVMALTRNEACVHEVKGRFSAPEIGGAVGQVVGEIDLRLFLTGWRLAYAVAEDDRQSLQFFDAAGTAILKVHATAATDRAAFAALTDDFADPDAPEAAFAPPPGPEVERPDAEVDVEGLRAAWRGLQYTHLFQAIPRKFGIGRAQAMRLAGPELARPVPVGAARTVLDAAAASGMPVMTFVGNRGCVQIQSGPVRRIEEVGPWLNVLDPTFNLHLRQDRVAAAFVVRKPSVNGDIHSLELFDGDGTFACQFFGHRAAGGVERPDWRALLTGLPFL